jgi:plastocyanin
MRTSVGRFFGVGLIGLLAMIIVAGCGESEDSGTKRTDRPKNSTAREADAEPGKKAAPAKRKPSSNVKTFRVTIEKGQPVGGPARWKVSKGDKVAITVTSDVADELHLHTYDVTEDVAKGGTATLRVTANTEGVFELELEHAATLIGNLQVSP